jgi:PRC-barrel domain
MAAFDPATLDRWRSLAIVDRDGVTVGTIDEFYLDRETGHPTWALVTTGLFGTTKTFVPLVHATEVDDGLQVPYEKNHIRDAPRVDPHDELTPDEEANLFAHYGVEYQPSPDPGTEASEEATPVPTDPVAADPTELGPPPAAAAGPAEVHPASEPTDATTGPPASGSGGSASTDLPEVEPTGTTATDPPTSLTTGAASTDLRGAKSSDTTSADPPGTEPPGSTNADPPGTEPPGPVRATPGPTDEPGVAPDEPSTTDDPGPVPDDPSAIDGAGPVPDGPAADDDPTADAALDADGSPRAVPAEPGTVGEAELEPHSTAPADGPLLEQRDEVPAEPGTADPEDTTRIGPDASWSEPGHGSEASAMAGSDPSRPVAVEPGLPGSTAATTTEPTPTTVERPVADQSDHPAQEPPRAPDEPGWAPGAAGSLDEPDTVSPPPGASDRWREAKLAAERERIARTAAQHEDRSPLERARRRLERLVGVGQTPHDADELADREAAERARRSRLGLDEDDHPDR